MIKEEYISDKISITTIHQSKGLERKVVILFDFSLKYFHYYAKQYIRDICPNTHYVALTRAKEILILIGEEDTMSQLPYLKEINTNDYITIKSLKLRNTDKEKVVTTKYTPKVTTLIKYLREPIKREAMSFLHMRSLQKAGPTAKVPVDVDTAVGLYEVCGYICLCLYNMYV